jgi:hypothetical protein
MGRAGWGFVKYLPLLMGFKLSSDKYQGRLNIQETRLNTQVLGLGMKQALPFVESENGFLFYSVKIL